MTTIPRPAFLAALKSAASSVESRPTTPILGMVHLAFTPGSLTLSGQTRACHVSVTIAVDADATEAYCVDPITLIGALSKAGGANVTLSHDDDKGRVAVTCGAAKYNLNTMPSTEYPIAQPVPDDTTIKMPAAALALLLSRVAPSIAPDDNRYGLSGVHLERVSESLRLVSTDGNRLAYDDAPATMHGDLPKRLLIPGAVVRVLAPMLAGAPGDVAISIGERSVRVVLTGATMTARLLEADFPDYRQVLPTTFKRTAIFNRDELTQAIQAVAPLAADANHTVGMVFSDDGVILSARKLDAGDARVECAVEWRGEALTIGINATFVAQALAVMPGERVTWKMGDALSPVMVEADGCAARMVLMPVRLD